MVSVDLFSVASPKLRASILEHRRRPHFIFPKAVRPEDLEKGFSLQWEGVLPPGHLPLNEIVQYVCKASGVTLAEIRSGRRSRRLSHPRMIIYWLACNFTEMSLPSIARCLGGRDHTTIISGRRRIEGVIRDEKISVDLPFHDVAARLIASDFARKAA